MSEQALLFPDDALEPEQATLPATLAEMHRAYGVTNGTKCGTCASFFWVQYANRYYKCRRTRLTHGPGTDWRAGWPACGQWQKRE